MDERDFIYWLQGFLELTETKTLNMRQTQIIKDHLSLVLIKVTPNRFDFDWELPTHSGTESGSDIISPLTPAPEVSPLTTDTQPKSDRTQITCSLSPFSPTYPTYPESGWIPMTCSLSPFSIQTTAKKPPIGFRMNECPTDIKIC